MKDPCCKLSTFFMKATVLALITSCQSQPSANPMLAVAAAPTPTSVVETRTPTPLPTPDHQAESDSANNPEASFPYQAVDNFADVKSGKLSGIVFYPPRATLFAVSDNGRIIEIKTDGTLVQTREIRKKADFEGITYSTGNGMLYIAVEGKEIILEVNPETLEPGRDIPIDRIFEGDILLSPEGNGIEGITFVPGSSNAAANDSFYLVNQSKELEGADPSIVLEVEIDYAASEPQARIIRYFSMGITDLSGIHFIPSSRRLLIISDANNLLLEVSLTGQILETHLLPGKKQEGIATDGDGFLYIAQDKKESLLKFKSLSNASDSGP